MWVHLQIQTLLKRVDAMVAGIGPNDASALKSYAERQRAAMVGEIEDRAARFVRSSLCKGFRAEDA